MTLLSTLVENKKIIMLVEDDRFISLAYEKALEKAGFEVARAADGEAAIIVAKEKLPSLIFLDLILPKKNGFIVLEELKADPTLKEIPVVILSNLSQEGDKVRGKTLGARDYMVKVETSTEDIVSKARDILL